MNYPPYSNDPNDPNGVRGQQAQWPQTGQPQGPLLPTQYAKTVPSIRHAPPPPPPNRPENMTVQNPYGSPNPYITPLQAPPPPRPRRKVWRRIFIVLGSVIGFAITSFGLIGLFITLQSTAGSSNSINSAITGFIAAIVIICVGTLLLCKSATSMTGRWIAGIFAAIAIIVILYGVIAHVPSNFIGGTAMLLLAGILFRTTRKRRW